MTGPDVLVHSINHTSTQAKYKVIKRNLGVFEDLASSTSNTNSSLPVTLAEIGSVLTTKSDHIEYTRSAKGCGRQRSRYIGGIVDFAKGTLTSVALPLPMTAPVTANKDQTLEERVNANKLVLDSENSFRTNKIMTMESARSMPDHQINLICQRVLGRFSKTVVKK